VAGFVSCLLRGGRRLGIAAAGPLPPLGVRVALLMPTYNEQPSRVMAGLAAIVQSLTESGRGGICSSPVVSVG
jgi:membrane glycosyltransferase